MADDTRPLIALAALTALFGCGCTGKIGGVKPVPGNGPAAATPDHPEVPLKRLGKLELANSVNDLIAALDPGDAAAVQALVAPIVAQYPDDQILPLAGDKRGGFDRFDEELTEAHIDIGYAVASALGGALTATPDRLRAVFGACAVASAPGPDCVAAFIRTAGERILRRPIGDEDVAFYSAPTASAVTADGLADVVTLMVSSPDFLAHIEGGVDDGSDATTRALTPWELASRLSYHFWATMPDDELAAAARDGSLADPTVYAREVERLYADPRTQATLQLFFAQWLRTYELPPLDALDLNPVFKTLAGANLPSHTLRDDALAEIGDLARWVTTHGGTVADLVTNTKSFARSDELAAIYGAPKWDGVSDPPDLGDPARAGLITRVAFTATGAITTNPILKGVKLRQALLCEHIPPPPPAAANAHVDPSPVATTRQVTETVTEQPGSVCYGCHGQVINGLGFATENFDPLGRARTAELLFDRFGNEVGQRDIDTRSVPHVVAGDGTISSGAADLMALVVASGKLDRCFAQQYFRFALARPEDEMADAATLGKLADLAAKKASMSELFKAIAYAPAFMTKTIPAGDQ